MRTYERSCKGKMRHKHKGSAIYALKRIKNACLSFYYCEFCKHWHIGHDKRNVQARIDQLLNLK